MAVDAITNGLGTTAVNVTQPKVKPKESVDTTTVVQTDPSLVTSQPTAVTAQEDKTSNNSKKTDDKKDSTKSVINTEIKNEYVKKLEDDQQKKEEEAKKAKKDEQQKEDVKKLTEELNSKMNQFNFSIKFGVNDKADSIAVSVINGANETNIKNISPQDAAKLADRMSFVLGVLFDQKS
jgi:uncharacterized FlaG/YvyC family protein